MRFYSLLSSNTVHGPAYAHKRVSTQERRIKMDERDIVKRRMRVWRIVLGGEIPIHATLSSINVMARTESWYLQGSGHEVR